MNLFTLTALLSVIISTIGFVQTKRVGDSSHGFVDEQELIRVERDYLDARVRNDRATLERIVADDFISTNANGQIGDKASAIANANAVPGGAKI